MRMIDLFYQACIELNEEFRKEEEEWKFLLLYYGRILFYGNMYDWREKNEWKKD